MNKLRKFSRAILAIVIMLCVALPTLAYNFSVGGIYYKYLDNTAKTVEVTYSGSSYYDYSNKYTGFVTIPSSVTYSGTTYSVSSIGDGAFYNCTGLTYIIIPNSVTSIGDDAFYKCSGLPSITIPNSVTTIGNDAFMGCTYLTSVTIPNSVTSIGSSAFSGCHGLTSITIPNSVTSIGGGAFYGTAWYNNLADGVIYINNVLYEYKGSMPNGTSISVKDGTVSISPSAFSGCRGLTSITIPSSVTSIGGGVFSSCSGLTSVIVENGNSKYDSRDNCNAIVETATNTLILGCKNSTIRNSVTSIGNRAFEYCSGLTSITIPNSVTSIGDEAFYDCDGLTSITIPNSVTSIGDEAFSYCSGLTSVTIGNSVTSIGNNAFYKCSGLTSITIPNSVTSIGNDAFYYCTGLTSITIPNSVTSIGNDAFYGTAWYKNLADGVIYINNVLYEYKGSMPNGTSISVKDGTVSISPYAFYECSGLTSITIPNSVTSIGSYAFEYCDGLTSITIPNSVTSIGDWAFYRCLDMKTIVSLNPTPPTCSKSFYDDLYSSATLYVPKDSYAKYFIDDVWGQFTNIKKIEILASSIILNNSTIELDKGNTATLSVTIAPSNATIKNIVWTSSNPQIATVDQSGKVTALTPGIATITAKSIDGSNVSASCKVTVNGPTITLSQIEATLPVNEIMTLSYSITNSATKTATWSTSNEYVAYVKTNSDGSATIVGMADGVATITATMVDNGQEYSASCVVTVGVGGVEGVEMDNNAVEVSRYDIHGRLLSEPTKGINIVKYNDGTTRKEFVKNLYY